MTDSKAHFRLEIRQELALAVIVTEPMRSVMQTNQAVQMLADLHVTSRQAKAEGLLRDL